MKILVIEDDTRGAELLADVIRAQGHQALVAGTAHEGLDLVQRERPDGVLLDIVLPELNGVEVLRRIRKLSRDLPVVIITGLATPEQTTEAKRLGVVDVIEKPLMLKHLSSALASLRAATGSNGPPQPR